jgi:hypothetical protein
LGRIRRCTRNNIQEIRRRERTEGPLPVIPAEAGTQAILELELKTNLDAGVRRHDEHFSFISMNISASSQCRI